MLALSGCSSDDKGGTGDGADGGSDGDGGVTIDAQAQIDTDDDGIYNGVDNCPNAPNPGQEDVDLDGYGDACDNCKPLYNANQDDSDGDGEGDACEDALLETGDEDGDGVLNLDDTCIDEPDPSNSDRDKDGFGDVCDNCPDRANSRQLDADGDGVGDACDNDGPIADGDGDGIPDEQDNCPTVPSADPTDTDGDKHGDACDNCPTVANYSQRDSNSNGVGDACENNNPPDPNADDDGDGVANKDDKCPPNWPLKPGATAAQQSSDADKDGVGDACDNCTHVANADQTPVVPGDLCSGVTAPNPNADDDGDGVPNGEDKCPGKPLKPGSSNAQQSSDADNDGVGDACDNCPNVANYTQDVTVCDRDGDGVPNESDNCLTISNGTQLDSDGDNVGDACDNCDNDPNAGQQDADGDGIGDKCDSDWGNAPGCATGTMVASTIKPDLYFLIDRSLSMVPQSQGGTGPSDRLGTLKTALTTLANQNNGALASNFNLGVGAFPSSSGSCTANQLPQQLLTMGVRTTQQFINSYNGISAAGYTPTDRALQRIRTQQLYNFAGDPSPNGPKAVVLITDGEPNDCAMPFPNSTLQQTVNEAAALASAGVPVYLLGFDGVNQQAMQSIANAGDPAPGNNTWYNVTSTQSIINALNAIATRTVSCTVALTPTGGVAIDPTTALVYMVRGNGTSQRLDPASYSISGTTLTLASGACDTFRNAVTSDANTRIEVKASCACVSAGSELCNDLVDNDCDGQVNEGCGNKCGDPGVPPQDCAPNQPPPGNPEICDGMDNDGDGMVDEGCPGPCTSMSAEICDKMDNNCNGMVDEGCPPVCTPIGEICMDDIDNDCDGQVDEGCEPVCKPLTEVCDGKDNDCDGMVDEVCVSGPPLG